MIREQCDMTPQRRFNQAIQNDVHSTDTALALLKWMIVFCHIQSCNYSSVLKKHKTIKINLLVYEHCILKNKGRIMRHLQN